MKKKPQQKKRTIQEILLAIVAIGLVTSFIFSNSNFIRTVLINWYSDKLLRDFRNVTETDLGTFESNTYCREASVKFQRSYKFCISEHESTNKKTVISIDTARKTFDYLNKNWEMLPSEQEFLMSKDDGDKVTFQGKKSVYPNLKCHIKYSYETTPKNESLRIWCSFRKTIMP